MRFALGLFLLCSCSQQSLRVDLTPPEAGGPAWHELTSSHFVLRSDQPEAQAMRVLQSLEYYYQALSQLARASFFGDGALPLEAKSEVLLFERQSDYRCFVPGDSGGAYRWDLDRGVPRGTLLLYGEMEKRAIATVKHELTHRLIHHYLPNAPAWLHEGTAVYFSTIDTKNNELVVGLPSLDFRIFRGIGSAYSGTYNIEVSRLPSPRQIITSTREQFYGEDVIAHYAGAWMLVHMLNTAPAYEASFNAYRQAHARGETNQSATDKSLATLDYAALERDFRKYATSETIDVWALPLKPIGLPKITSRVMSDNEVRRTWLSWLSNKHERWTNLVDGLEKSKLRNAADEGLLAKLLRHERPSDAAKIAESAIASDAKNAEAWHTLFFLAENKKAGPEREAAVQRAVRSLGNLRDDAGAQNEVGWYFAEQGKPKEGLPFAERSVKLSPACYNCLDTLARLRFDTGDVASAIQLQERAISYLPEKSKTEAEFTKRLAVYKAKAKPR